MPTEHRRMGGATQIGADVTTVDCHKQVRSWRLLRALMELLIPRCNCTFMQETNHMNNNSPRFSTVKNTTNKPRNPPQFNPNPRNSHSSSSSSTTTSSSSPSSSSSLITGTIFGYRKGKVKFCIQTTSSTNPILLLELAVPTTVLAREMRSGLLRIALECSIASTTTTSFSVDPASSDLLEMPAWRMYCNGRRVGYALRRQPSKADVEVLSRMRSVVVGAGVIEGREIGCEQDDIMYLRGNFERVCGSSDAESFHLIDPDGSINQDLSIFFLRSP